MKRRVSNASTETSAAAAAAPQHSPMGKLVFGGDDAASPVSDDQFKVTARGVVLLPVCSPDVMLPVKGRGKKEREREWRGKWKMTEKTAPSASAATVEVVFSFGDRERRRSAERQKDRSTGQNIRPSGGSKEQKSREKSSQDGGQDQKNSERVLHSGTHTQQRQKGQRRQSKESLERKGERERDKPPVVIKLEQCHEGAFICRPRRQTSQSTVREAPFSALL